MPMAPLENPEKSRFGGLRGLGSIFNDNSKHGRCPKLRTYILIDVSFNSLESPLARKSKSLRFYNFRG